MIDITREKPDIAHALIGRGRHPMKTTADFSFRDMALKQVFMQLRISAGTSALLP
jgi:hypothetical protein